MSQMILGRLTKIVSVDASIDPSTELTNVGFDEGTIVMDSPTGWVGEVVKLVSSSGDSVGMKMLGLALNSSSDVVGV